MKRGGGSHVKIAAIETAIKTSEEPAIIIGNMGRRTFLIGKFIKREPDLPRHRGSFSSIQRFACRGQPNAPTSSTIEVFSLGLENRVTPKVVLASSRRHGVAPPVNASTPRMTLRPDGSMLFSPAVTAGGCPTNSSQDRFATLYFNQPFLQKCECPGRRVL